MNYELAKELKDAGFPQKPCAVGPDCEQWWYFPGKEAIHAPTLEELIEACGDNFGSLGYYMTGGQPSPDEAWRAYGNGFTAFGSTPTEAVARLWLALHKK